MEEKNAGKKRKFELAPHKWNHSIKYSHPATPLELIFVVQNILHDSDRAYMCKVTHLQEWNSFYSLKV